MIIIIIVVRPHRSIMYVDVAYCYRPTSVVSVCLSATVVSSAKTAKLIQMQFGMLRWVSPVNHVLDGV